MAASFYLRVSECVHTLAHVCACASAFVFTPSISEQMKPSPTEETHFALGCNQSGLPTPTPAFWFLTRVVLFVQNPFHVETLG